MHPTFCHDLATARIADLHHDAARERTAKAAAQARRAQPHDRTRPAAGHIITSLAPGDHSGRPPPIADTMITQARAQGH